MSSNRHRGQSKSARHGANPTQPQTTRVDSAMLLRLISLDKMFLHQCATAESLLSRQKVVGDRLRSLVAEAREGPSNRQSDRDIVDIVGEYRQDLKKFEGCLKSMRELSGEAEDIAREQENVLVKIAKEQIRQQEGKAIEDN
ncbi:hypothetical protein FOXYSP1_15764 [Fusarium oxysporum f. sp. phaseoli]